MTAFAKDYNRNHFFDQGAVAFLVKPVRFTHLKEILATCIAPNKGEQVFSR